MSLQSQCLCGFPEGTVEMRRARSRALTPIKRIYVKIIIRVEMRRARSRALTHFRNVFERQIIGQRRNDKSPFKGIDTRESSRTTRIHCLGRNDKSPFRALTSSYLPLNIHST